MYWEIARYPPASFLTLFANDKAAGGNENRLVLVVRVTYLQCDEIDGGIVRTSAGSAVKHCHHSCQGFARIERGEVLVSFFQVNESSNVQAEPGELLDKVGIAPK